MSKLTIQDLLFNDQPITINRKLAKCLGLKEAVVFQQIHYWLEINKKTNNNYKEGKYWTYNSVKDWQKNEFDFMSVRTVERTLQALEKSGLLESACFNKMAGDKTKWYTINYNKLLEVCDKKLAEKEKLSAKRSESGKKGAAVKKANNDTIEDTIQPTWQNGEPYNQLGRTIQPTWQNDTTNLAEPIPETTTETTTETTISSSSSSKKNLSALINFFEENICSLKKTTTIKFKKYTEKYDIDFIKTIISYGAETNAKSFKWFESVIENYIEQNITTSEAVQAQINEYRYKNKQRKRELIEAKKEKIKASAEKNNEKTRKQYDAFEFDNIEIDIEKTENISGIKNTIKKKISETQYKAWIDNLEMFRDDKKIIIDCPSQFAQTVVSSKYSGIITSALIENNIHGVLVYTVDGKM